METIKANELRIGNYINVDNEKYHPNIKDVTLTVTGIQQRVINNEIDHCLNLEITIQKQNTYYEMYNQYIQYILLNF